MPSLKRIVSACLPSYFVDAIRTRRWRVEQVRVEAAAARQTAAEAAQVAFMVQENQIDNWEQALARAGNYGSQTLSRFRIARSALHVPDGSLLASNLLALVARLLPGRALRVTDFGGSTGELGQDFVAAHPGAHYCVVENPVMAELMRARTTPPGLSFTGEMPDSCDIFYCSGALQYLRDPMDVLARGLASAGYAALLRRNYFADHEMFDIQHSSLFDTGIGELPPDYFNFQMSLPRRTLVEAEILALADAHGFDCIASLNEQEAAGPEGRYGRQLVFWRRGATA